MSISSEAFATSIQDAENLLKHFNQLNTKPPPPDIEVLKRAGLIMAMTAWETYVEDRILEASESRIKPLEGNSIAEFIKSKLDEEIKRLHNPNYEKTVQLFRDYADVDLKDKWCWNNFDEKTVKDRLNSYMKLRGDVVHRSRPNITSQSNAHPITKDELEKLIRFLKGLVEATENAFN